MPLTAEQYERKLTEPALCEQLPVRDYLDNLVNEVADPKRHSNSFELAEATMTIPLDPSGSDDKMLWISSELDPK